MPSGSPGHAGHIAAEKARLRQEALALRATLPLAPLAEALLARLADLLRGPLAEADPILAYAALPGEVDILPLARTFPARTWALPRVVSPTEMVFQRYKWEDVLTPGAFGIAEPEMTSPTISPASLSPQALVLVPGVAFDLAGNRLGFGKGYYDRFLAACPAQPRALGVCPEALLVERLPADAWDVPMTAVVTEARTVWTAQTP